MEPRFARVLLVALLSACAGPPKPEPFHYREGDDASAVPPVSSEPRTEASSEQPAEAPGAPESSDSGGGEVLSNLRDAPPLPAQVDAGAIARPELMAVLSEGIPHFLRRVHTEPMLSAKGQFVGWRLTEVFRDDPRGQSWVIKPGDVVLRVNGHSIERPEQFQNVWNNMGTSSELVVLMMRGDQTSEIRYRIE